MKFYYDIGTVTVTANSPTVTGVLTNFLNVIHEGDLLLVGNNFEVVKSVESNTQLTLVRNWAYATSTNTTYRIILFSPRHTWEVDVWTRFRNALESAKRITVSTSDPPAVGAIANDIWFKTVGTSTVTFQTHNGTSWSSAISLIGGVASVAGRTGNVVLTKSDVGLSNVDNTTDANKPLSTAAASVYAKVAEFADLIVNGSMNVSQENGDTSVGNLAYVADQWIANHSGPTVTYQRVADAPPGYTYSIMSTIVTPAATTYTRFRQYIEAWKIAPLAPGTANARKVTIGFWVKCSMTGQFAVRIGNNTSLTSQTSSSPTINAANTWEYKVITLQIPTSGTWTTSGNGLGMVVEIFGGYNAGPNLLTLNTAGATFQITGVSMLPASEGLTAENAWMSIKSKILDFQECTRYYRRYGGRDVYELMPFLGFAYGTNLVVIPISFLEMRSPPSIALNAAANWQMATHSGTSVGVSSFTANNTTVDSSLLNITTSATITTGAPFFLRANNNLNALLNMNARL